MTMKNNTKNTLTHLLALAIGAGAALGVIRVREREVSNQEGAYHWPIKLPYEDLASKPRYGEAPRRVLYDFGSDSLIVLRDLAREGNYDQLEITNCNPYREGMGTIYISRDVTPNAREDEKFRVVDKNIFDTFNQLLPEEK